LKIPYRYRFREIVKKNENILLGYDVNDLAYSKSQSVYNFIRV